MKRRGDGTRGVGVGADPNLFLKLDAIPDKVINSQPVHLRCNPRRQSEDTPERQLHNLPNLGIQRDVEGEVRLDRTVNRVQHEEEDLRNCLHQEIDEERTDRNLRVKANDIDFQQHDIERGEEGGGGLRHTHKHVRLGLKTLNTGTRGHRTHTLGAFEA